MHLNFLSGIFVLLVISILGILAVSAEPELNTQNSGIYLSADDVIVNQTGNVSVTDILTLLNQSGTLGTPSSVFILQVQEGAAYSPDVIKPVPEILFLLNGTAEISANGSLINASAGDTVVIPTGSELMITNTGTGPLKFFSVLSSQVVGKESVQTPYKRTIDMVEPVSLGNVSDATRFSIQRILNTNEDALPLSFDLAVASLPAGHIISAHYLKSGQIGYVLAGTGNVTIGSTSHVFGAGDLVYIPPSIVQEFTAETDLQFLLLTEPYYKPENDFPVTESC